jgi:Ca2+-transporting ATPase
MGISGTQVAINASDIVLMDDNFASIVSAIKWGRNVLNSVRKFLQFQLSVNFVAVFITIVSSATDGVPIIKPAALLWINLIMDSLGALSLASEKPTDVILLQKPHKRSAKASYIRSNTLDVKWRYATLYSYADNLPNHRPDSH